jgi:ABC-type phosphate transport system substrate-binding protein
MKLRIAVIAILCVGLVCSVSISSNQTYAQGKRAASANGPVAMTQITVLNPMGTPPPITLIPQAPRLNTLDGKTIYLINTGYIGTDRVMAVLSDWFKANHPKTNIVYKDNRSGAGLSSLSKELWAEVAEKGDAAIVGLGH